MHFPLLTLCNPSKNQDYMPCLQINIGTNVFSALNHRGGVEVERSPRMREIGVQSPVVTDLSRKNR